MSEPQIRIRIKIAERDYPMTVTSEQEARLRVAGRMLNERIKQFRDTYGLPEHDILAMIALDAVADQLLAEQQRDASSGDFHQNLEHLHELLLTAPTGPVGGPPGSSEAGSPRRGETTNARSAPSSFTGSSS